MNENTYRINKYDNLKGLAIILIVLGHLLLSLQNNTIVGTLKDFIWIFHLPIFYFVAGYFSKIGPDEPIKSFKRILIPYFIFCIVYTLFKIFILNEKTGVLFLNPTWCLWFLISLFTMKLMLPILDKLKYPLIISFILALLVGFLNIDGEILGITRTFTYLPIFLIGFYYNDYKHTIRQKIGNNTKFNNIVNNKKIWIILLIISLIICFIAAYKIPTNIIQLKYPYKSERLIKTILTGIIIVLGIIITLLFNKVMTNNETFLTMIGKNSMAIYLLHVYFVALINKFIKSNPIFQEKPIIFIIFSIVTTMVIVFILSRNIISKYLKKLIDFIYNMLAEPI